MAILHSPFHNDIHFKMSSSAIIILDAEYYVVDVNNSALENFEIDYKDIIGKNIIEFTAPSEFEINYNQIQRLINGEIPNYTVRRKFFNLKNQYSSYEILISLLKDPVTNKIYFSGLLNKLSFFKTKKANNIDNEKIDTLINQSPVMQYILDIKNDVNIYENKNLLNYLGYKNSDLGELSEFDFLDTKVLKKYFKDFKTKIKKYKKSNNPADILELEYPILNSKGEVVWLYDKSSALKVTKTGKKIFSYGIIIDITRRKLNEQKIKEQQVFIEKVSQAIPEFIFMLEPNSQDVLFSNNRCKQVLGYTEVEFNDITREELLHPASFVEYNNELIAFKNTTTKQSYDTKVKLLHKTKGYRCYKIRTFVFDRDKNSKPKRVLKIIEDINENEINVRKNKEQQNFITNVTSKLPSTVYVVGLKEKNIVFSNVKRKNIFGYTNTFWKENVKELIHPNFIEEYKKSITKFIKTNNDKTLEYEILIKHITKGYRWYKTRLKIISRNIDNEPEQILEIFDDIHDVKMKNIKIAEQEHLITTITNAMTNYQYLCDIEKGLYTYTNFENKKIFGYTKKEYLGRSSRLVHPEHKEALELFKKKVNTQLSKTIFSIELQTKPKHTDYIWVNYKVIILKRNEKGLPSQLLEIVEDINEAKKKVIKIAEQQDLIEKISSAIPEFIYLKNYSTNKLIFSNNKAKDVLGYKDKEFVSTTKDAFIDSSQIEKSKAYQKNILVAQDKNIFSIDLLLKHKTKGLRWYKNTSIIFERDENQKPLTTLELVADIHASKMNEEQILEQQYFIENISSTIPQFLSVYNIETNECVYTNFENKLIFGYSRNEYLENRYEIIHPDYKENTSYLAENMLNAQKANFNNAIEYLIYHKTRGYIWVSLKIIVTKRNNDGDAIQALEILEDIDKSKKSFNQILEQQSFIQKVASTIPNIVQVIDLDNKNIIYSNFQKRTFLAYNKHEWESLKLDVIHEKHYNDYIAKVQELILSKNKGLIKDEILVLDKNGDYKWVLAINSLFKVKNGKAEQIMTVFTDINDTKLLQLILEKQLSKNLELERFASITSHDLKEPLRTLGNYAQILKSEYAEQLDEDARELIEHIAKSSKRMDELINDILDFSKVQTEGKKFEEIALNELIKVVLDDLKDLILESKTVINIVDLPIIEGDKTQLRQIFQNLISNAIKFTKDKTPIINIDLEVVDDNYVFSVEDNGIGIKAE
ncbi:MAG: PAS domain-containing protein, partial [Chitinophagales bacterium]